MVPLGWALQASGHDVWVMCDESQVDTITRAGLTPAPVLHSLDVAVTNRLQYHQEAVDNVWRYPWLPLHPLTGAELSSLDEFDVQRYRREVEPERAARAERSFDAAVEFARAWRPDLVLYDSTSLEGLLVSQVLGVPAALVLWGLPGTHEAGHMCIMPPDISGSFPRYGLGELSLDMITHVVDPCPATLAPPVEATSLPVRYVPYNGAGAVPDWLLAPSPRRQVCVVWSTALTRMSGPRTYVLPEILRALSTVDCTVVCTLTPDDAKALGTVGPSVRLLSGLPLRLLLPRCDAVVHHGGAGTTMTALWAGVPQLALTFASEQAVSGGRMAAAGAGRHIFGELADQASIGAAVTDLLDSGTYRRRAALLRSEILLRHTPTELVGTLEKLASG
jgi:hypothetical protein